jgi:hypothetical protein
MSAFRRCPLDTAELRHIRFHSRRHQFSSPPFEMMPLRRRRQRSFLFECRQIFAFIIDQPFPVSLPFLRYFEFRFAASTRLML